MAKRFKFRLSRLILCFQSCGRSKHSSNHLSDDDRKEPHDHHFLWKKEEKWHVVAKVYDDDTTPSRRKIYNSSASGGSGLDDDVSPLPSSKRRYKRKKTRTPRGRNRVSTSSADHSCGLFSSDGYDEEEEETEALVSSSRSETSPHEEQKVKKKKKKKKGRGKKKSAWWGARLSAFEGVIGWRVEGKVRESMAVVKKSENPYEDFRRSMMEMILEKQMFEEKDLEQLLCCFLSLNSAKYHPLIVQAFTDIWEALFCFCKSTS